MPRWVTDPSSAVFDLINQGMDGKLDSSQFIYRAIVTEIDHVGGLLEETPVPNPRNSIRAKLRGMEDSVDDEGADLPVFWPLFPHDIMPLKEGEAVYVVFEDPEEFDNGLWIARIPEHYKVHSPNITPAKKQYEENPDNDTSVIGIDQATQDSDEPPKPIVVSEDFDQEDVPLFKARVGDRVIEGSNNTTIVLGRDRPSGDDSGEKGLAGSIDIVAGRAGPDDMSDDDKSRVYISMKTGVDANMGTVSVGTDSGPSAAIGLKSDEIRVVARNGMKLVVEGGDIFIEGANIHLGPDDAGEAGVLGDTLKTILEELIDAIVQITVNTAVGPSIPPVINKAAFDSVKSKLQDALSETIKLKK